MYQKLILPINKCKLTASMKTKAYQKKYGFIHYGADMVSTAGERSLYGSGIGTVVAAGRDSVVGNVVIVCYPGAENHRTGKARDVVFRYFHLESIAVTVGQPVGTDTLLGIYGNTGMLTMANHLHLEADTDIAHPLYSPTVSRSSFLKGRASGATDTTMSSPLEWLHIKADSPGNQTYTTAGDDYILAGDKSLPSITGKQVSSL